MNPSSPSSPAAVPAEAGWPIEAPLLASARAAVAQAATRTRVAAAPALGRGVFLKLETEQETGSFKVRGALARLAALEEAERAAGVVTASAGNHGLGVAFAAARLGVRARVWLPASAPAVKREGIARLGAEVVEVRGGWDDAEASALDDARTSGRRYVSAFDDPHVAAGNGGTLAAEVLETLPELAALVVPVGGGGLLVGAAAALRLAGAPARLVGVQSDASPTMARSLERGRAIERWPAVETLAEGLAGGVAAGAFERVRATGAPVEVVTERALGRAMGFARDALAMRVEGSAAVVLAWALGGGVERLRAGAGAGDEAGAPPVVLVLTGRNVDPDVLARQPRWRPLGG